MTDREALIIEWTAEIWGRNIARWSLNKLLVRREKQQIQWNMRV